MLERARMSAHPTRAPRSGLERDERLNRYASPNAPRKASKTWVTRLRIGGESRIDDGAALDRMHALPANIRLG